MATAFSGAGASIFTTTSGAKSAAIAAAAAGDILVVVVALSGDTTIPNVTDDQGGLYHEVSGGARNNASADKLWVFFRSSFLPTTASTNITMTPAAGTDTGGGFTAYRLTGMLRPGKDGRRQLAVQENQAAGTPAPAFSSVALTGNSILGAVLNLTNPATMTPPAVPVMTEKHDLGYLTPTEGLEVATADSGFTGTTITWGSASATGFSSAIIETDGSAATPPRGRNTKIIRARTQPRRAGHVIAPRPAGLAVVTVAPVVAPPRPTLVIAHARTRARGGVIIAPRAPSTLPPAFAKPPLPRVVLTQQHRSQHPGHVTTPRPSGLAIVVVVSSATPPRPTVVLAHPGARPHGSGHVVTAARSGLLVVTMPPRPTVVSPHGAPLRRHGAVAAPRPVGLASVIIVPANTPVPRGYVVLAHSRRPHARGGEVVAIRSQALYGVATVTGYHSAYIPGRVNFNTPR